MENVNTRDEVGVGGICPVSKDEDKNDEVKLFKILLARCQKS